MAKVLVIDDNDAGRKAVATILAREGYVALEAADGAEGLALARAERPQVIISDILMPRMDGYEFVRHLREQIELAATAVIFHTAHFLDAEAQKLAHTCHVARVLAKPCGAGELLSAVADALGHARPPDMAALTGSFSVEHLRLLTNKLAANVTELQAEVIERKRAEERVLHLNRVHAVLSGINGLIVRAVAREELCREACKLAVAEGHFSIAWIGLNDPDAGRLIPFAWAGEIPGLLKFTQISAAGAATQDDMVSQAMRSKQALVCNDLQTCESSVLYREELLAQGQRSLVVFPLLIADAAVGCLVLVSALPGIFDADEMRLLNELAGDIAFALDHIEKAERLDYLAYYDALTGLANRRLFFERITQKLDTPDRRKALALVVFHIERLESINESLGRHVGDELLRQAAERFAACTGNPRNAARIGSDHLATLIEHPQDEQSVMRTLEGWLRGWLDAPFVVQGHEVRLSAKAGIALYPGDGHEAGVLLANAEAALNTARESAERCAFYTQRLSEDRAERISFENKLRRALEHEEFVLHYQPKVDLQTRRLNGVEALIRWQSPDLGFIPPIKFIPLLEEMGLIVEVGAWVMRQASFDRSQWLERRLNAPRIAVNVSAVQLARADFVRTVSQILKLAGAEAGIDIEVTESLMMTDVEANIDKLAQLRDLGVSIAIDDFGTGYSSLGYLARLPAHTLKIDRSFVVAMSDDPGNATLVSTIISMAHALKLKVIAEGVETEEQARTLQLLRCDDMQGYLISKPLPFGEMTAWLERNR